MYTVNNWKYTMDEWRAAGTFDAAPGQEISGEVYEEMKNCLPSKTMPQETARRALHEYGIPVHEGFLMGEARTTDKKGNLLYLAFGMNDYGKGKHYFYLGLSEPYKPLHGQYYYFDGITEFGSDSSIPAAKFANDAEAIRYAADHETALYKTEYDNGEQTSSKLLYQPMFL